MPDRGQFRDQGGAGTRRNDEGGVWRASRGKWVRQRSKGDAGAKTARATQVLKSTSFVEDGRSVGGSSLVACVLVDVGDFTCMAFDIEHTSLKTGSHSKMLLGHIFARQPRSLD